MGGKTKLECGQYLLDTRQWQEAIELYQQLDTNTVDAHKTTLDSIKGRTLFLYTDGLNEAENPQQEQFGDSRLLEMLRHTPFNSARQVIEALKTEVETHRNGAEPNDDLTMMCLRIN